jgi:hypothetical protein
MLHNFKKIKDFLPVIIKDEDYDFASILNLLRFKLNRMHCHFTSWDCPLDPSEARRIAKQIKYAIYLIDRYYDESGFEELADTLTWDKYEILPLRTPEESKRIVEFMEKDSKLKQEYLDRLFRHMAKYIQTWWD